LQKSSTRKAQKFYSWKLHGPIFPIKESTENIQQQLWNLNMNADKVRFFEKTASKGMDELIKELALLFIKLSQQLISAYLGTGAH
jgi:hypothetical protein